MRFTQRHAFSGLVLIIHTIAGGGAATAASSPTELPSVDVVKPLAELGDADAQFVIGEAYHDGRGGKRNYDEAARWYRLAANQGHAFAEFRLGYMLSQGEIKRNYEEAAKWYRLAAAQGIGSAQNNLGVMYSRGLGVPLNAVYALMWYLVGASTDGAEGALQRQNRDRLQRTMDSNQIQRARDMAARCTATKFQECGDVMQSDTLARAPNATFEDGLRAALSGDHAAAFRVWQSLAEKGDARSQASLGILYTKGQGVARDVTEAAKWLRRAAEQGDAGAQVNLGIAYFQGDGVAANPVKALTWFTIATGNPTDASVAARGNRDQLRKAMIRDQIVLANTLAVQCLASKYTDCDDLNHQSRSDASAPREVSQTSVTRSPPVALTSHAVTQFDYPATSIELQEQGKVAFTYTINTDGTVADCTVTASSGVQRLDLAACAIADRWLFKPAMIDGKVVAAKVPALINFALR